VLSFDVHMLRVASGNVAVFEHKTSRKRSSSFSHWEEKWTAREANN